MGLWERGFAAVYDRLQAPAERGWMGRRRRTLLADLSGRVLEVGGGTGANLAHYPATVDEVVVCEPSAPMRARLADRPPAPVPVVVCDAPGETLPFDDDSFDAVVATLVLCTVPDVDAVLAEVRRVLRPDGRLHVLEHGGAAPGRRGRWQRRLEPIWRRVACGCRLTRDARSNLGRAGFRIESWEEFDPRVPPIMRPFAMGVAAP